LPVIGFEVLGLWFAYSLDLFAYGDNVTKHLKLVLNGVFDYIDTGGEVIHFNVETAPWRELVPLFDLRYDRIKDAVVSLDSELRVDFESGRKLIVPPDKDEAWEAWAPGVKVVGTGGEPAVWTGKAWEQTGGLHREADPHPAPPVT
jgi:hypothetical protein